MLWHKIPFLITDSTLNFVDTTQRNEALLKSFTIEIQQFQDSILSNLYGFKRFSETKVLQHRPILSIQQHPALSPIHAAMPIRKAATQSLPSATGTSSYSLLLSTRSIDISDNIINGLRRRPFSTQKLRSSIRKHEAISCCPGNDFIELLRLQADLDAK
jgi:hypothetical protein